MDKIGKYMISGEIGKGGMGVVYRGQDPLIGRPVAIKTVRLDVLKGDSGRDDTLKRFLREAQAAGNLSHPNIVTIYDVGEHEGLIYIAMEFIDGSSLESLLQQKRQFTLAEIVAMFDQIGSALDHAHRKGIVHRDIKPANILVDRDLRVSIVDFGIARTTASTMTQTGMLMGTPRYMSPEQIAGKKVDSRSDIFSLGAILYELLTQRNPFEGESITTVIYKIMHAELPPLSDFNRQLPAGLEEVVNKALARDAEARYRSCGELLADLHHAVSLRDPAAAVVGKAPSFQETQPLAATVKTLTLRPAKNRRPFFFTLAVLLILLALAVTFDRFSGRKDSGSGDAAGAGHRPDSVLDEAENSAQAETAAVQPGAAAETAIGTATEGNAGLGTDARKAETGPRAQTDEAAGTAVRAERHAQDEKPEAPAAAPNKKGFLEQVFFNRTVMVRIPQGSFTIGSPKGEGDADEHPAHKVFVSEFWLGKTEVTFEQFDLFCRESGRRPPDDEGWGRGGRPVIHVSWDDAAGYCRWLAQKTGRNFRLPREAEWEKAARDKYPWGWSAPGAAMVNMKGSEDGFIFTAPVGSFPLGESPYGIQDMAGNVWEWLGDWYDPRYYRVSGGLDPLGPEQGEGRAVRGGSWRDGLDLVRSANRSSELPERRLSVLGFRVAMDER